ncbi:hypothetical protein D9758_012939 [Tetrapyrgos nigripes]|uniref:Uncharacterized protein n=1 Tax=Tetrapyrgos nigripes TaxID=182062 RepID=A0A8H5CKS2_9AGAR|nr:hypothetical protein D9758_012939 [Tetrapyrgos nigripes]
MPSFAPNLARALLQYPSYLEIEEDIDPDPPRDDIVTFDHFRGILGCAKMIRFEFYHPYPLDLHDADIKEISVAWPQLQYIDLCSEVYMDTPPLSAIRLPTLHSLVYLTRQCPDLETIALLMDTKSYTSLDPSYILPELLPASDKPLFVGCSTLELDDTYAFAMSLGQILSPQCELDWFCSDTGHGHTSQWKKMVENMFPLFCQLQATVRQQKNKIRFCDRTMIQTVPIRILEVMTRRLMDMLVASGPANLGGSVIDLNDTSSFATSLGWLCAPAVHLPDDTDKKWSRDGTWWITYCLCFPRHMQTTKRKSLHWSASWREHKARFPLRRWSRWLQKVN